MEMVSFKVENGESEKIRQDAYAHGMNKSEYLRFLVEKERERMNNAEKKARINESKQESTESSILSALNM